MSEKDLQGLYRHVTGISNSMFDKVITDTLRSIPTTSRQAQLQKARREIAANAFEMKSDAEEGSRDEYLDAVIANRIRSGELPIK